MTIEVSRRRFFGASAGAVVAAPKVARSLTDAEGMANQPCGALGLMPSPQNPPQEWLVDELKSALRRRRSATGKVKLNDYQGNHVERFRLEGMRSLSPVTRARLAFEDDQRREAARELNYVEERISELREQLGPLAALIEES